MKTIDEMLGAVAKSLNVSAPQKNQSTAVSKQSPVVRDAIHTAAVPDRMTLALAKKLAAAAELAAGMMGLDIVVAVADEGANTVLLHAMDNALIASTAAARDKAYTAAALRMPTYTALEMSRGGDLDGLESTNGLLLLGGGEPLLKDGRLVGAVGISGGTKDQDIIIAKTVSEVFAAVAGL